MKPMTKQIYKTAFAAVVVTSLIATGVLLAAVCSGRERLPAKAASQAAGAVSAHRGPYRPPRAPAALADSGRAVWTAIHYWDGFDFADTVQLADMGRMGPAVVTYLQILGGVPASEAAGSIRGMLDRAMAGSPAAFERFAEWYEEALYDPNSPLRNEELYIPVLEYTVASPHVDSLMKVRPRAQLEMALRNRPGDIAADFTYTAPCGGQYRMSALKACCTLLYFYNPDCSECRRVKEYLAASEVFAPLVASRSLAVLAIYPDEDMALWRERLPQMPDAWTVGCDKEHRIVGEGLYDLKAIPTLYLLGRDKRVILKDVTVEEAEAWLGERAGEMKPVASIPDSGRGGGPRFSCNAVVRAGAMLS